MPIIWPGLTFPGSNSGGGVVPTGPIIETDPGGILLALRATAIASGILGPVAARIECSLERESFPYRGNSLYFMPGPQTPEGSVIDGGGRNTPLYRGQFTARYVGRSLRDSPGADLFRLTNPGGANPGIDDTGLLPRAGAIASILLNTLFLIDASGNYLSIEPVEPGRIATPSCFGTALEWSGVDVTFTVAYLLRTTVGSQD